MKRQLNELYQNGLAGRSPSVTVAGILSAVAKNLISMDDAVEIIGPEQALDACKAVKAAESKLALAGYLETHPLTWVDGNQYSVTAEKQSLLTAQLALYQTAMAAGQPYILRWNTTGGVCSEWTAENLSALALAIGAYVQPLVSYQQEKEVEILSCTSLEELNAVVLDYGGV